jgi:ribosomal protein L30/L7E
VANCCNNNFILKVLRLKKLGLLVVKRGLTKIEFLNLKKRGDAIIWQEFKQVQGVVIQALGV